MKRFQFSVIMLILFSMILGACAPAVAVQPNAAVVPAPVTQAPTADPAPDIASLYAGLMSNLPADKSYASIKPVDLNKQLSEANPPFLLDVREVSEVQKDGYIKGAINIPVREVLKNLDKLPSPDTYMVVYCGSGQRSGMLLGALRLLGYNNALSLGGGMNAWKTAKLQVETGIPAAATSISTAIVADQALFTALDKALSALPDGFLSLKADAVAQQMASAMPTLIDIRLADERLNNGYVKDSVNIPFNQLFNSLDKLPAKDAPVIIYCGSGHRGAIAILGLRMLGYTNILNMGGGFGAWKSASLPIVGVVDWTATWADYFKSLPANYYSIKADVLNGQIAAGNAPFLVDVREPSEIEQAGFIKGAINIPVRNLLQNLDKLPAQDKLIVIYCGSAHRGSLAMSALRLLGYTNVLNLAGGFGAWTAAKLPVETGKPADPVAGTAPSIDPARLRGLNAFLSTLPDGFYSVKDTDVQQALDSTTPPIVIDVRTPDEIKASGAIKGSTFIPINEFFGDMTKLPADKATPIIVTCQSGHRAAMAMMAMRMVGYTNVNSLFKGINAWSADNLPLEK